MLYDSMECCGSWDQFPFWLQQGTIDEKRQITETAVFGDYGGKMAVGGVIYIFICLS